MHTRFLQRQLIRALLWQVIQLSVLEKPHFQTLVPTVTAYIPIGLIFLMPLLSSIFCEGYPFFNFSTRFRPLIRRFRDVGVDDNSAVPYYQSIPCVLLYPGVGSDWCVIDFDFKCSRYREALWKKIRNLLTISLGENQQITLFWCQYVYKCHGVIWGRPH